MYAPWNPHRPGHWVVTRTWMLAWVTFLLAGHGVSLGQSGISTEGPWTIFRTGANEPLLTLSMPLSAPATDSLYSLQFEVGFATAEPDTTTTFYDSFSMTLRNNDRSATALLLTADRAGVQWAPFNPGGIALAAGDVQHVATPFANLNPPLPTDFAYAVSFALPPAMVTHPFSLFLDLFDNLNQAPSLAYVSGIRIETVVPQPKLLSAAVVSGTYTEETGAILDAANRTFTTSTPAGNRFFRVSANQPLRIVRVWPVASQLKIEYEERVSSPLTLLVASAVQGPLAIESSAVWNDANRTFTLPKLSEDRFFRISGNRLTRIIGIREIGAQVVVEYQFIQMKLSSAAGATGPYAEESSAVLDETNRTFTVRKSTDQRFYRVLSDVHTRLKPPRTSGEQLVLEYEINP